MKKIIIWSIISIVFTLIIIAIYERKNFNYWQDLPREWSFDALYLYSRTVRLTTDDGQFYNDIKISSNSQKKIDDYLKMNPAIRVYPTYTGNRTPPPQPELSLEKSFKSRPAYDVATISTEFLWGNIPTWYTMQYYFNIPPIFAH